MDPQTQFCHNFDCPARGVVGQGNIQVHSRAERRYKCTTCGRTFAATRGTPFYRKRTAPDVMTMVLTLLTHGCPLQAIVAAFGLDERTVAAWQQQAGRHRQQVHAHVVQRGRVDLQHVQADELWVKMVGRRVWMAMAMAVPSRLWLGGVISPRRDLTLIMTGGVPRWQEFHGGSDCLAPTLLRKRRCGTQVVAPSPRGLESTSPARTGKLPGCVSP